MKKSLRIAFIVAVGLAIIVVGALGCGGTTTTTAGPTTTKAPATTATTAAPASSTTATTGGAVVVKEWDIPFLVFLSGAYGGFGAQMKWSVEQAVTEINAAGGIAGKPVVVTYQDTALDPAKASAEMSKAVGNRLTILGPVAATEAKAAMPMAMQNGMFSFAVATGTDITKEFAPWLISFFPTAEQQVPPLVDAWVKLNPGIKSVAQFTWPLDPTWMGFAKVHSDTLQKAGIKTTDIEVQAGVDMGAVVVKAMAGNPDAYIITVGPVEAAKIVQELDKRGVTDHSKILIFQTADDPALYDTGGATLNGAYIYNPLDQHGSSPRWQSLLKRYQDQYKIQRGGMALIFFYDALYLVKQAIEATGATGDPAKLKEERLKIRDYVQNVKAFDSVTGAWDIVDGYAYRPTYLFQIKDGDTVNVGTFQVLPAAK
jgi:branched-chain amino acid transport system substrate-binding protein